MDYTMTAKYDAFQDKIDENFKELPNVFGIADDILIVVYVADGKYHDIMLRWSCTYAMKRQVM